MSSDEEIFNRYATNEQRGKPNRRRLKFTRTEDSRKNPSKLMDPLRLTPARVYMFNFFLFSSLGSLMPFLPVFYKLLGFSSLQNGILYAIRPLISFWWGPLSASLITRTRYRQLLLFLFVAGAITSTFCLSVVRSSDGGMLSDVNCNAQNHANNKGSYQTSVASATNYHPAPNMNRSLSMMSNIATENGTKPYSWKTYIKDTSTKIYHQLEKGILMKKFFTTVLLLTIVSELFISPTLHVTQASIKFSSHQMLFNSQCLNRVFCKIGMIVAALAISYVAWKYQCIFSNVHYFYFHFYGFLTTGCITAMFSLILPSEQPKKTSFFSMICSSLLTVIFDWGNFGYVFGLWIAGISEGAISAYLLWYATANGASEIVIGIFVSLALITDMLLHFTVGYSMRWIGHMGLLSVGIFFLSIQFCILANVTNPYLIIPTQLLFGLASCCIRSSFVGCTISNGTKEMEKVMFFVFQASYMGLGLGLGGIFISMPYYVFGPQKTFSALAVMTAVYSCLFLLTQIVFCKKCARGKIAEKQIYTKVNSHEPNSDWLVNAMQEEEDQQNVAEICEVGEYPTADLDSKSEDNTANNNEEDIEANMLEVT